MNIWITGSAGFLGNRLAFAFNSAGHRVLGLSRRPSPSADTAVTIDLADRDASRKLRALTEDWGQPEAVIHAACLKPGNHSLSEYVASNVSATATLLDALEDNPPRQLIFVSTMSVLALPSLKLDGSTGSTRNDIPYLVTKRCSEQLVEGYRFRSQVIVLRLPSLYGAGQTDSFIDGLARLAQSNEPIELFGRGETVRDVLHVDDAVKAVLSSVQAPPQAAFSCFNLGCGQRTTSLEYAEALVAALASKSAIVPVDKPSPQQVGIQANITEASKLIGFNPMPLSTSMERYANELRT
jgi:nucleoside-diphosphate-sugar epimerase